ncbi:MAG: hypothetical protein ACLR8Y_14140 [Alistipes indistinctus]
MPSTLFGLIKKTTKTNPGQPYRLIKITALSLQGPVVEHSSFPASPDTADYYGIKDFESVISAAPRRTISRPPSSRSTARQPVRAARSATASPAVRARSRWPGRLFT